jgi:Coenzyme PQQ synthesis protein D (PqqD)
MRYSIDASNISHERLQDEVIIINAASGAYYSGSGNAADIWTLIVQGASVEEAANILARAYSCDEQTALGDVKTCVGSLLERAIIQEGPSGSPAMAEFTLPQAVRAGWVTPAFDEYTDMWDLIQLDPIHDVGDAGWPHAAPSAKI